MQDPDRLDALTGLRIFAAFAIVLHHLKGQLWLSAEAFQGIPLNQGVGFFYVLSGFILQHSYRHRLTTSGGGVSPVQFIVLRFFRLWPCHIAVILLLIIATKGYAFDYFIHNYSTSQILAATFLLQAWHPDIKVVFALNGPAWSISVELFFYAMFPLLCRKALKSPLSPLFVGATITIAWLTAIWLYMPSGNFETLAGTNPLARILEFSVGISAYECFTQYKLRFRSGTFLEIGALAFASLSVVTTPVLASFVGNQLGWHLAWWLGGSASFLAFSILIGIFSWQNGLMSRFVGWKPVVYLGEISFALYLVHQPVINYLTGSSPWFIHLLIPTQILVFAIIVLGLSAILHHVIEKPCMDIAKRLVLRRKDHGGQGPAIWNAPS